MTAPNVFKPHSLKQNKGIYTKKRTVICATGIQWGKTSVSAIRMVIAMHKYRDPSDNFIMTAPNYKIMQQATLPEFLRWMEGQGTYNKSDAVFYMHGGGTCYMRTSTDPDSVVGITNVRLITGDEAGLFPLYFHENLQARSSIKECPIIYTTSPYSLNWLYTDYIRPRMKNADYLKDDLELIQARSDENPYFPKKEFERKKATMDPRRFNMIYGGEFHKLEGLVYDCFDEDGHIVPKRDQFHELEKPYYIAGVDWGYTNPAVIIVCAVTRNGDVYVVDEYYKSGKTIGAMVDQAKRLQQLYNIECFYCDPSSPANIVEFNKAKLTAVGADNDIRAGVDATYDLIHNNKFFVFAGKAPHLVDEMSIYHYPTENNITPDKDVKDQLPVKQHDHACIAGSEVVRTKSGLKEISKVYAGDFVLTPMGFKEVLVSECSGERPVFRYDYEGGSIKMTDDHPTLSGDLAWNTSRYCDSFFACDMKVKNIILTAIIGGVHALSVQRLSIYIEQFGKTIMEKFQKVFISITKTTINTIMTFQISNLLKRVNIFPTIVNLTPDPHQKQRWMLQPSGIDQMRRMNSTYSLEKCHMRLEQKKTLNVKCVERNLKINTSQDSVRTNVSQSIGACQALTMFIESVPIVRKISPLINTLKPNIAPVSAVTPLKKQKVYNLKVKDAACYYVSGVLVSNCDALRYVCKHLHAVGKQRAANSNLHRPDTRLHYNDRILRMPSDENEYDW